MSGTTVEGTFIFKLIYTKCKTAPSKYKMRSTENFFKINTKTQYFGKFHLLYSK